jgi:hypothetical protein
MFKRQIFTRKEKVDFERQCDVANLIESWLKKLRNVERNEVMIDQCWAVLPGS